jgi:hypothetical protein
MQGQAASHVHVSKYVPLIFHSLDISFLLSGCLGAQVHDFAQFIDGHGSGQHTVWHAITLLDAPGEIFCLRFVFWVVLMVGRPTLVGLTIIQPG